MMLNVNNKNESKDAEILHNLNWKNMYIYSDHLNLFNSEIQKEPCKKEEDKEKEEEEIESL
jgi:hypothetical protein